MNKYVDKWIKQGRTDEQIEGVLNFMTGQGKIMLEDLQEEAVREFANHLAHTIRPREEVFPETFITEVEQYLFQQREKGKE